MKLLPNTKGLFKGHNKYYTIGGIALAGIALTADYKISHQTRNVNIKGSQINGSKSWKELCITCTCI